jgi:hypothetical protein
VDLVSSGEKGLKLQRTKERFWMAVLLPRTEEFDYNQHRGSDGADDDVGQKQDDQSDNRSAPLFWRTTTILFS